MQQARQAPGHSPGHSPLGRARALIGSAWPGHVALGGDGGRDRNPRTWHPPRRPKAEGASNRQLHRRAAPGAPAVGPVPPRGWQPRPTAHKAVRAPPSGVLAMAARAGAQHPGAAPAGALPQPRSATTAGEAANARASCRQRAPAAMLDGLQAAGPTGADSRYHQRAGLAPTGRARDRQASLPLPVAFCSSCCSSCCRRPERRCRPAPTCCSASSA